jgi:hypothetical protein
VLTLLGTAANIPDIELNKICSEWRKLIRKLLHCTLSQENNFLHSHEWANFFSITDHPEQSEQVINFSPWWIQCGVHGFVIWKES